MYTILLGKSSPPSKKIVWNPVRIRTMLFISLQSPKPAPYVKEMGDQALFYGNRVIKEYKGKDE